MMRSNDDDPIPELASVMGDNTNQEVCERLEIDKGPLQMIRCNLRSRGPNVGEGTNL